MEIGSTNHHGLAEPDLVTSGVAGTGQKNETEREINKHQTVKNTGEFSSLTGFDSILQGPGDPDGFSCSLAFGQIAGTTKNPVSFAPELCPASLKKCRKKTLVIGMGVLYNGEITPLNTRNNTTSPADPDAEVKVEELIIPLIDQQDMIAERFTKKIDRLDRMLTVIEERRRSA